MELQYDIQKLNTTMQDFYNVTGININLLHADFSWAGCQQRVHNSYCRTIQKTASGRYRCHCSDRKLLEKCRDSKQVEMHICHAGLVDVAVPILLNDTILGYLILGQMKQTSDFPKNVRLLEALKLDCEEMEAYYRELPYFEQGKIQSIANVAAMLAKYILLEKLLQPNLHSSMERALAFIRDNLEQSLSIQSIAKHANVSKSALYRWFHTDFGCTVNEYITRKRIEKSMELLETTDWSVEEISQKTGFSTASYYSRMFKKQTGISPLQYRKTR